MIDGLKPYAEMKDSGVEWLGTVPTHWDIVPAFVVYRPRDVRNTGMTEKTVLSLSYGRIVIKPEEKLRGLVPESFETYQIVEPGNIIVRTTDLQNDRNSLRIGHAKDRGIITSAYLCLETTSQVENEFGYQYLNAYDLLKIIYGYGSGLRQNLDFKDIKRMPVLLPPKDEQAAIVRFLDHADRRIRRAIAAKQKLIRLLEEQKRAVIHRAVTRGLDPDVRLKPSGVEWLGDVPEHWELVRLGRVVELVTGFPFKSEGFSRDELDIKLLRGINISPGRLRWEDVVRWPQGDSGRFDGFALQVGDIVLGMDRPIISSGVRVATITESDLPALLLQRVARIRPNAETVGDFILQLLSGHAFAEYLAPIFTGISVPHLSPEQIKSFRFALPSREEQVQIVKQAGLDSKELSVAIATSKREIELLREYRIRLVADVVTGKLNVREAAAKLPEMVEPDDSEFDAEEESEDDSMEDLADEDQAA
jgi:type I restriction enzyme S subunit